jgi:enamine deaminase RidA (YjgF/YER057c/UK114 family)
MPALLLAALLEVTTMPAPRQTFRVGHDHGLPFSSAVRSGDLVYAAGVLGTDGSGRLVEGGIREQTRQALRNLAAELEAGGARLETGAALQVYLTSASDFAAMNEVYRTFFTKDLPTRTTVVTGLVLPGALIEIAGVAVRAGAERKVVHPEGWAESPRPYSYGIRTGDTLFLSGLIARSGKDNSLVPGDMAAQTRTVLDNARQILAAGGMDLADVVSARVFITDPSAFQAMNEAYRGAFAGAPPARATVVAGLMGPEYLVEITFVAVKDAGRRAITTPKADGTAGAVNPNLSSAIQAGGRLYLSGMLGNDATNRDDAKAQTRETLARIGRTLAAAGLGFADVVDGIVYVTDAKHFAAMNEAYREAFGKDFPARATVVAGLVAPGGVVEIMFVAAR